MESLEKYNPDFQFNSEEIQKINQRIIQLEKVLRNIPVSSEILKKESKQISQFRNFLSCSINHDQYANVSFEQIIKDPSAHLSGLKNEQLNYSRAEDYIKKNSKQALSLKLLKEIQNVAEFGNTEPEFDLFNPLQLNIAVYIDPEKAAHLNRVLDFINNDFTFHPLVKSWILHFEIAKTAPLPSGNEKLARLIQYYLLVRHQLHLNGFLNLEAELYKERTRYFSIIRRKFKPTDYKTQEINFALEIINKGLSSVEKKLKSHYQQKINYNALPIRQRIIANYLFSTGFESRTANCEQLVPRQKKITDLILQKGFVSTKELVEEFGCNRKTIQRDFAELMEMNIVKSTGNGSALKYSFSMKDKENEDLEKFQTIVIGSNPQTPDLSGYSERTPKTKKRFDIAVQTSLKL